MAWYSVMRPALPTIIAAAVVVGLQLRLAILLERWMLNASLTKVTSMTERDQTKYFLWSHEHCREK
jgi:hypothetical protein